MHPSIKPLHSVFGSFYSPTLISKILCFLFLFQSTLARFNGHERPYSQNRNILFARNDPNSATPYEAISETITEEEFYQTRFNFGVNLGGCFVREKWIYSSLFPKDTDTELEAVTKACEENRVKTQQDLETFWKSYMSEEDWDWLRDKKVNSVRIPIGYWNINEGKFTKGTLFEPVSEIYKNSWKILKTHFIEPAEKRGISVLVDLHSVPGGANPNTHNGEHVGETGFWKSSAYQELAVEALQFIAKDLKTYKNIYGIQVVNEAEFSSTATAQKHFYKAALQAIRKEDNTIPVVISDGWWPNQWVEWIQDELAGGSGLVVDHHCYRCFADADTNKNAKQIINDLDGDVLTNLKDGGRGVDFMVAEWSCVLSPETWRKSGVDPNKQNDPERLKLVEEFCSKEEHLFEERARAGSFFWTFKFESGNGGDWDFKQQLGHSFHPPNIRIPTNSTLEQTRDRTLSQSFRDEKSNVNADLYKEGYNTAWNDGLFYARKGALIGRRQAVKEARRQQKQSKKNDSNSNSLEDWEKGYEKGLQQFENAVVSN